MGFIVVAGAVIGGFIMEGGHLLVLFQPVEFLIIGGAATGALLVTASPSTIKAIIRRIKASFGSGYGRQDYTNRMVMLCEIFNIAARESLVGLESHNKRPCESEAIGRYPSFLKNHHVTFLLFCINLPIFGLS